MTLTKGKLCLNCGQDFMDGFSCPACASDHFIYPSKHLWGEKDPALSPTEAAAEAKEIYLRVQLWEKAFRSYYLRLKRRERRRVFIATVLTKIKGFLPTRGVVG